MARLLRADGTIAPITEPLTLAAMQRLVGGYIETVSLGGSPGRWHVLIVNEDGRGLGLKLNARASMLYRGNPPRHDGVIVGDAIECVILHAGQDNETVE